MEVNLLAEVTLLHAQNNTELCMSYHLFEGAIDFHHPVLANLNEETTT
jgi:hypothetical protein